MDKGRLLSSTSWRSKFRDSLSVDVNPSDIHNIFKKFGLPYYEIKKMKNGQPLYGYYESEVNDIMSRGDGLKNELIANGVPWEQGQKTPKTNKKPFIQYTKPKLQAYKSQPITIAEPQDFKTPEQKYVSKLDIQPEYRNNENDMEKYSEYLINNVYQEEYKPKKVKLTESQFKRLFENTEEEGFQVRGGEFNFAPNKEKMADTHIFDENGNLKVRKMLLPKSQVMSYNLYELFNMTVSKGLKHRKDMFGNDVNWGNTIDQFITRSALYMKRIIGDSSVDYITYPQSSSKFNQIMVEKLRGYFPNSQGIKIVPEMLTKNIRGIYVNTELAKQIGLTNQEIHDLQRRVEWWKVDEDVRDIRRKLKALTQEIEEIIASRGKGRPSNEFRMKQKQVDVYNDEIKALRKSKRGRDGTFDKETGNVKDWQIKSLDEKHRKAIEGIFQINPKYLELKSKLQGKTIILFDDNISSGATLDDLCLVLKMYGVLKVIPITLGVIPSTVYAKGERKGRS